MALYGDLTYDSRVLREAESLARADYVVTIACLAASPATVERLAGLVSVIIRRPAPSATLPGDPSPFYEGSTSALRRTAQRLRWLWRYRAAASQWGRSVVRAVGAVDVWHAHDLTGLEAIAPHLGRDARIVYDSHELFLDTGSAARMPGPARLVLRTREAGLVRRCAAVITVNPGLAAVLHRRYRPVRLEIVRNCPERWVEPPARPQRLRETLGIPPDEAVVLFHGALVEGRGIERLAAAMRTPELATAHLVLLGDGPVGDILREDSRARGPHPRLHVIPSVPPSELPSWVASADLGAVLQEPQDRNLILSTPNKLFESIATGTPVIASDLPEIRRVVLDDPEGPLGVLCDPTDIESIADGLRSLLRPPRVLLGEMRERCRRAGQERLNWETEAATLVSLYGDLRGDRATTLLARTG
jgi:glycosyltransferase involved in cell wall biosynthesis